MKKLTVLIMSILIALSAASCTVADADSINVMAVDGAPGIVVAKIANDDNIGAAVAKTQIVSSADEISTAVANGTADVAVLPLNLAAKLYNGGVDIKLAAVSVFGSLYMVGTQAIESIDDLVGEVVYNIGRGGTPDLTFKYILEGNGIEYVESQNAVDGKVALQYVSAASELIPMLKTGKIKFGIMGEPAVTNSHKVTGVTQTVLDIQAEWKKLTGEDYTQAGVVVKGELVNDESFMDALSMALSQNGEWINANAAKVKEVLASKGSTLKIDYTADIFDRCNVGYGRASEMKTEVEKYLSVIMEFNDKAVGGKLPAAEFYY